MHTLAGYEWDPKKAAANLQKHGVDFVDAAGVFADDLAVTVRDSISSIDEERFVIVGTGALGQVLVVVYVWRGERIRIISARPATPQERRTYEGSWESGS